MPGFTKKIMKNCADDLQAGEELLQATVGQPTGTFSCQAIGGVVGVLAAKKIACMRDDGAGESGMAASVPKDKQLLIGLTDRRILFFDVGAMSGNAKELAAAVELRDVHGMSVEKHKMTYSLTITFADNSARIFECVRMTKPQDIVDAFDKMKGTRAA
jgi:hypothetical protein